ncbi:MAG: ribbon-helix-helix protein, CopG family [Solirubrobacterales bacterium]
MSDVKTMSLRLPAEQAKELEAVAAVDNIPVSEVVRDAIDALIESRRKDKAFKARLRRSIKENNDILERLAR